MTSAKTDQALLLTLGLLGIFPEVFVGYLSSAFIDSVIVQKHYDRAFVIILCYFLLNIIHFAQRYSYARVQMLYAEDPEWIGPEYFEAKIKGFVLLINGLLVLLLDAYLLLFCVALLAVVRVVHVPYAQLTGRSLSEDSSGDVMTALHVCVLFLCGLFVMRGRMTIGELYAADLFTQVVFAEALHLMFPGKEEEPKAKSVPGSCSGSEPVKLTAMAGIILRNIKPICCTLVLALIGTLCQGIYVTLQGVNLSDCIPAGDWSNLLRNCIFMASVTLCGYVARRGNRIGFRQIFHNKVPWFVEENLENIADLVLAVAFALYYATQIRQVNGVLASQVMPGSAAAGMVFLAVLLSEAGCGLWGEELENLLDMLSSLFFSCMTAYIYSVLGMGITEISAGELILFLAVFEGFFYGISALGKLCLIMLRFRAQRAELS